MATNIDKELEHVLIGAWITEMSCKLIVIDFFDCHILEDVQVSFSQQKHLRTS